MYTVRVLLCLADVLEVEENLKLLSKVAVTYGMALVICWSSQEAATYLQAFRTADTQPAEILQKRVKDDFDSQFLHVLTSIRGVNKTDVANMKEHFNSFDRIVGGSLSELTATPGLGDAKVHRIYDIMRAPFVESDPNSDLTADLDSTAANSATASASTPLAALPSNFFSFMAQDSSKHAMHMHMQP